MEKINVLGIGGSLRSQSSSNVILRHFATLFPSGIQYREYNTGGLPLFDDSASSPDQVRNFRELVLQSDGVVICQPEYAYGVSGSLKNALDWLVGSGEFVGKPVVLVTAATGGEHAHAAMKLTLTAMNTKIIEESSIVIGFVKSRLNADGTIKDNETALRLSTAAEAFVERLKTKTGP